MSSLPHSTSFGDTQYGLQNGATDISTGFSAESFVYNRPTRDRPWTILDPWRRECFVTLVNLVVNYPRVYYPLPTAPSQYHDEQPQFMEILNKQSIVYPDTRAFPGQVEPEDQEILNQFQYFSTWAVQREQVRNLLEWLDLQDKRGRVGRDVPEYIKTFWENHPLEIEGLGKKIDHANQQLRHPYPGIPATSLLDELMYAFSVMFRGLEYCVSLAPDVAYFRHPLKQPLFLGQEHPLPPTKPKWSWGGVIARLIEHGKIPREKPQEVIDHVVSLREIVQSKKVTWHDLDLAGEELSLEDLETIAGEARFPPTLKDDMREDIRDIFAGAAFITGPFAPFVSVALGLGSIAIPRFFKKGTVPGSVGQLPFMRAALQWPEVDEEWEEMHKPLP